MVDRLSRLPYTVSTCPAKSISFRPRVCWVERLTVGLRTLAAPSLVYFEAVAKERRERAGEVN